MSTLRESVSSPTESLILVNDNDEEIGIHPKAACHEGEGLLHRAFSVFLFNRDGELLLQQRSALKPLWPLFWSNSCCSHPRENETIEQAGHRRIYEELQLECDLQFLYKFKYQASFGDLGSEHELCHVFAGYTDQQVVPHPDEIAEWRFIHPDDLSQEIAADESRFTPWLKMEWKRITAEFLDDILVNIPS
ncbi:MAG: isopentenyl-diphosphate Delta-isomerase [Gammaproteobacteria bacterium]|nr:isopentenyl-diphosphate Delta-isomerase [Gammaproteobacteria bacterium]